MPTGPDPGHPAEPVAGGGVGGMALRGRRAWHADWVIAAVILGFCALVYAITLTFSEVPASLAQGMGPEAFPRLVVGTIAVLAGVLAWSARGRPDPVREPVPGIVYLTGLALVLFMGVVAIAGLLGAILFAVIGIGRLWGERRWWLLALSGLGLALTIRLLFVNGFGIPLPRSLLATWLS